VTRPATTSSRVFTLLAVVLAAAPAGAALPQLPAGNLADGQAQPQPPPRKPAQPGEWRKPAQPGEWIDGGSFRFRVDEIVDCGDRSTPSHRLLAFKLRIVAGAREIFVSPHDITLEASSVILQTEHSDLALAKRCEPRLTAQRLSSRKQVAASAIFAVSPEFAATAAPLLLLVYRPTRWGGAGRLEVQVPACLAHCAHQQPAAVEPRPGAK
jgi:hypothetical protein